MSGFVVDASVAAKWFLPESHSANARSILSSADSLHAPDFFLLEMDSLFCKRSRRGDLTEDDAHTARVVLRSLPIEYYAFDALRDDAFQLAIQTNCSVYDCLYLTLSVLLQMPVTTADRRFYDAIAGSPLDQHMVWVADTRVG